MLIESCLSTRLGPTDPLGTNSFPGGCKSGPQNSLHSNCLRETCPSVTSDDQVSCPCADNIAGGLPSAAVIGHWSRIPILMPTDVSDEPSLLQDMPLASSLPIQMLVTTVTIETLWGLHPHLCRTHRTGSSSAPFSATTFLPLHLWSSSRGC